MLEVSNTVKTRLCVISDTHTHGPMPHSCDGFAYRQPLPKADVLLHAGDITMTGRVSEYEKMLDVLKSTEAELKIVIAGNHDITLDKSFYDDIGGALFHRSQPEDLDRVKEIWTGSEAKEAGIIYLEEGTNSFMLNNGATFTVYTSPWQPAYETWAFNYFRSTDRYNPSASPSKVEALNPIPSWPEIDLVLTHGPPFGILDTTWEGEQVGCRHLLRAVRRCRPRIHCFGHIHEGWGAERMNWSSETSDPFEIDLVQTLEERSVHMDVSQSGKSPLEFGEETIFVNAAIMNKKYRPTNAPWIIDLDLPLSS